MMESRDTTARNDKMAATGGRIRIGAVSALPAREFAYMPSPATYMLNSGKIVLTPPHTTFYAPFLTNAEIGGMPRKTAFVDRPGPHGVIIVRAGQTERWWPKSRGKSE